MSRLLSDRAEKTDQVVSCLFRSRTLQIPARPLSRRSRRHPAFRFSCSFSRWSWRITGAPPIRRIGSRSRCRETLWISTVLIWYRSVTFETARRVFRKGKWRLASRLLLATASSALAFLAAQITAWRELVQAGRVPGAESAQLVLLPVHRPARRASDRRIGGAVRGRCWADPSAANWSTWSPTTGTFSALLWIALFYRSANAVVYPERINI